MSILFNVIHIFFSPADYTKITHYFISKAHGLLSSNWCLQFGSGSVRLFHNNRVNKTISDMFRQRSQRRFTSSSLDKKNHTTIPADVSAASEWSIHSMMSERVQWNAVKCFPTVVCCVCHKYRNKQVKTRPKSSAVVSGEWNVSSINLLAWLPSQH